MNLNITTILLIGLTLGVFADRHAERRHDVRHHNHKSDKIVEYHPRFGGKNSVLLKKQKLVEPEILDDNSDEDDDDMPDDVLTDKNKENLIGFIPVKGRNGDTYLIPQSAIETIQKEYDAAGNNDGAILVPEAVVEVVGQAASDGPVEDGDSANVVIPKEALAGIDEDSVLALVEDGTKNHLGQNILVLKNIQSNQSELLGRKNTFHETRRHTPKTRNHNKKRLNGSRRNFNAKRYTNKKQNYGRTKNYYNQYLRNHYKKLNNAYQYRIYNGNNGNQRNYQNKKSKRRYEDYFY